MKKLISIFLVLFACSCTNKKAMREPDTPTKSNGNTCDTTIISYSCMVKPILESNCYSCHSSQQAANYNSLDLESFSSLKQYLQYYYRNDSIYGSKFIHTIMQSQGTLPMPPAPGPKLSNQEIYYIQKWIASGANNN